MWVVIGYGNSLRSDDRFGLEVSKELQSYPTIENLAEIIITHQLTPELIETVSQVRGVIFVDASADLAPGELQFISLDQTENPSTNSSFNHHCTPHTVLEAAQELYGHSPQAWLCTVGGTNFEMGEELSPPVKTMVPKAAQLIFEKCVTK